MKIQYLLIVLMFFSGLVPITVGYDPQLPSTVYVDATYDSGTPGWGTDHFATISNGISGVAVDGTVIVHPGTYNSISVNKRVILKGDNRNTVIIDGGGSGTVASFLTDGINMSGFTIQHGDVAIDLLSDDNIIFMNKIVNNDDGVVFVESDRNTFYYNDFIDNTGVGMELYNYDNFYNLFYFNNFLNCTAIDDHPGFDDTYNRWNLSYGTYPDGILGGNYWYDMFDFTDIKYGPNQNIPGSDGICDNEYTCGRSGVDYYPYTDWIYPPTDTPPVISDMNPENASVLIDTTISDVEVKITDTRPFNWSIEGSYVNRASGAGDSTGIKTATLNTPLPAFTTIYWYVNISDGMYVINQRFSFSTTSPDGGNTLQDVINSAPEGSTLNFPRGTYESDNAIIDKPLTLNGFHNETIIDAGGVGNGFLIESDNVKISNMTIMNTGDIALILPLKRYEHQSGGIDDSYPITSDRNKGQSFKTGYGGDTDKVLLDNIKIYLDITGPDTYDVDVRLMMCTPVNVNDDLVGPISNIHTIPRGALVNGWNTIDFSDDNYVLENNTWYGVAVAPNTLFGNVSGDVSWGANTGNPYGQGHAQISDTFTWIYWSDIATNSDFMFEIWGYNTTSEEYAGVFLNNSHFSEVKNCVITDTRNGIWVNNGDHNSIDHNYINESFRGIYISSSIYNTINGNNVSGVFDTFTFRANGCTMPIYLRSADYNNVTNNTIDYNDGTGVVISTSTYVKIYRNHIYRNNGDGVHIYTLAHYAYISDNVIGENEDNGIFVESSTGDTISNNDIGVNNNFGILLLYDVDNCSVSRNIVHSNINIGIGVWMTSDTKVFKNNVSGNENGGIYVYYNAYRNKIYENNIYGYSWDYGLPEYQPWGIKISLGTAGNKIYHNNFFDLPPINVTRDNNAIDEMPEGTNFWNDSYPSGGNYYEDFHNDSQGAYDRYRGNYQSIPGEDGICDENSPAPYINGYMIDWYPLRSPYTGIDLTSAGFSYMPIAPKEKARVNFTSLDVPSENIVSWLWDFGDGTTGEGRQVYHNYPLRGFYNVELRVINNRGFSDSSVQRIFIGPRGPFIPDPEPAKYPGFTMEEMYRLLRSYDLPSSNETMTIFVIDSGVFPATYEGIDLTKIDSQYGTGFTSGTDGNGHGCIDGDSYIFTTSGLIKIRDYYENINIEGIDTTAGSTKFVNNETISLAENGMAVKDDIYAVHKVKVDDAIKITTLWNKTLLLTPWHPTPVIVDNKIVWKRADEITTNDYVVFLMNPIDFGEYQTVTMMKRDKPGPSELISKNMIITEDLAWLIGFTIGDGTIHSDRNCVLLNDEKLETLEKAERISIEYGFSVGKGIYPGHSQNGNTLAIYGGLDKFFDALKYNNVRKEIPDVIFKSPLSVRESFVAGLFDAEGYVWESNGIRQRYSLGEIRVITSVNENLCKQLITILDSLGLPSSYERVLKNGYGENPNNNTIYAVLLHQKWNLNNFYDRVCPYVITFKKDVIKRNIDSNPITSREVVFLNDYVGLKVKKTEKEKVDTYFYDLSTQKYNNYYASGFIVHNTWVNYAIQYLVTKRLPNVKQISYRIFDAEGSSSDELFMQAFDVAERLHPDVISISAGALGSSGDQFSKKVEQLRSEGILVVVASGNFGPTVATVLSPGCSLGAFTVAGSDPQWYGNETNDFRRYGILDLSDDEIESWSSRGPVPGIYPKPDVTAPGESILGPWVAQPSKSQLITKALSGTSMATPLISASSLVVLAQSKGQADLVKMLYFWNKGIAVTAFEDAVREGAVKKGAVNDWGAGIAQFDKIQQAYAGKLQFLIYIWFGALVGIIIIILVVTVLVLRRSKTPRRAKSSWGKWTSSKTKSSWKGW